MSSIQKTLICCAGRAVLIAAVLAVTPAVAQAQGIPGSLQPGRVGKDVEPPKPVPEIKPSEVILPATEAQQPPANAEATKFVLRDVVVSGNSAISASRLAQVWEKDVGKEVSLADIYLYARAVTDIYQREGYVLSLALVPVQQISEGKVRLTVVEGYIDEVNAQDVNGNALPKSTAQLKATVTAERPLKLATLERALLLLNDEPGTSARAYLRRSANAGATNLVVIVSRSRLSASVSTDNHGTKLLGPARYDLSVAENGQLGLRERNALALLGTYDGRLAAWSYTGDAPVGTDGLKAAVSYSASRARPKDDSGLPDLVLRSSTTTFGLSYPIRRSREGDVIVRVNWSVENAKSEALGLRLHEDKVRPLRAGVTWSGIDDWSGINLADAEISRGIRGMGASPVDSPLLTRQDSKIDFTKFTIYLARLQTLGAGWSVLGAFTGQYSRDRLVPLEQLGLGGEQFLRGFDASELLGDKGFGAKLELRWAFHLSFTNLTAYAFYDHGQVWNNDLGGGSTRILASSTGIGLRVGPDHSFSGYVELDKPLVRDVEILGNRNPRMFAGLMFAY